MALTNCSIHCSAHWVGACGEVRLLLLAMKENKGQLANRITEYVCACMHMDAWNIVLQYFA